MPQAFQQPDFNQSRRERRLFQMHEEAATGGNLEAAYCFNQPWRRSDD